FHINTGIMRRETAFGVLRRPARLCPDIHAKVARALHGKDGSPKRRNRRRAAERDRDRGAGWRPGAGEAARGGLRLGRQGASAAVASLWPLEAERSTGGVDRGRRIETSRPAALRVAGRFR